MDEAPFHDLLQNYFYPLRIGKAAQDLLQEFIDIDVTHEDLERILGNNPLYLHLLDEYLVGKNGAPRSNKIGEREREITPTHRLTSLLGMVNSRNLLLALRLARCTQGKFPYSKDGKLALKPETYLKFAIATEEFCQFRKLEYAETAYAGAFLYDWLAGLGKQKKVSAKIETYIDQVYKNSMRIGVVSYGLAQNVRGFGFMRYAMAAGLSTGLGKIVMAMAYREKGQSWIDYQMELERKPIAFLYAAIIQERKKFQADHAEITSLCLGFSSVLQMIEGSVCFYQEPFYLKNSEKNIYQLAVILYTAAQMAKDWKIPIDVKDPIIKKWKSPWLNDLRITDSQLVETMKWAVKMQ